MKLCSDSDFVTGPCYDACIFFFLLMSMLKSDDASPNGLWTSFYIVGMNDSICVHRIFLGIDLLYFSIALVQ